MIDLKEQPFGCEIEMTGLTRQQAAQAVARLFGTQARHTRGSYDPWEAPDREGKIWRFVCFESTLHAGRVRANITLALAISAQAINQKKTRMRKTEISENPAFTFRTFLLRLGLIGPEYKNVRRHLLENLPGDKAWRYDKSQYPSLNSRREQGRE